MDPGTSKPKSERTLQRVRNRLQEMGDMPIFSATVNRIHQVGADPDADAMALAVEILKDASLSAKLLQLANSSLHNPGMGRIGNLSRAVVVLGFDTVRSVVLTLKLIDSFQQQNPGVDITGMLVNAYLSASFVRGLASRCQLRDIEQSYICGLLHNLGEVVTACTLPEEYRRILQLRREQGLSRRVAETRLLGLTVHDIGQAIASDWEFPQGVVQTLGERRRDSGPVRNPTELTAALATLSAQTMSLLYDERPDSDRGLTELTRELAEVAGIRREEVGEALRQAFHQCCDMAQAYGLDRRHLAPRLRNAGDEALDKLARQFSFHVNQELPGPEPQTSSIGRQAGGNPARLLDCLYEITTLMSQRASINTIFAKVLEGLHRGAGFDRALLCLLSPDHSRYAGRLAAGEGTEALMAQCQFPLDPASDLFSQVIMDGSELLATDVQQLERPPPPGFASDAGGFMVAALRGKRRPVGMIYADRAHSRRAIDDEAQRNFRQLVAQAQLALQMR